MIPDEPDLREPIRRVELKLPDSEWRILRESAKQANCSVTMAIRQMIADQSGGAAPVAKRGRPRQVRTATF